MSEKIRKMGIDIMDGASWGTHICQFYQSKEDLIDILVPYFKAGLENNEFCMWVTSESLNEEEAKNAMRKALPDFDRYLNKGQIEIVPYTEWYLNGGTFNLQTVLNAWIDKLNQALLRGYDGLRVTGNTAWLERGDWVGFTSYEEEVNKAIDKYQILAICTYPLDKCRAYEIIDVVSNHESAFIKQNGKWRIFESAERKSMEKTLKESEEKLCSFMESATDGFLLFDSKLNYVEINRAGLKLFPSEVKKEDIIEKNILEIFPDLKQTGRYNKYKEVIKTGKPFFVDDLILSPRYGEKHINMKAFKVGDSLGIITTDITERKKAEEELRASEQKFKDLTETTTDWIWEVDKDGAYTYVSPKVKELLGYEVGEVLGKTPFDLMPEGEAKKIGKFFKKKVIRKEPFYKLENINRHKDGHLVVLETNGIPIFDEKGQLEGYRGIDRDITERKETEKRLEQEKRKTEKLLTQLDTAYKKLKETQDEFLRRERIATTGAIVAGVAHEIRNPLGIIGMTIQYLQSKLSDNDPKRELTEAIIRKVERLDRVTRELSSYGRTMDLNIRKHNLARCLNLNLSLIKPKCRVGRIKIKKKYSRLPLIEMDDEQMDKVFLNIMDNAIKAMPKGGVLTVSTEFAEQAKMAIIKIHNTGPAIKKKHLPYIFEPFYTFKKDKNRGTGLGLAIAQSVAIRHNGEISIKGKSSGKDKGVAFIIRLPISFQKRKVKENIEDSNYGENIRQ